ncbi:MAG TPA: hypothetical protein VHF22_09780, partial [Planctomycetota bacterium]|nr:hypothetical protein [Planctomycetota bacterium]
MRCSTSFAVLATALPLVLAAGCGVGYPVAGVLASSGGGGGGGGAANAAPTVAIAPVERQKGEVAIEYALADAESDAASIEVEFALPGSSDFAAATRAASDVEGTTGLATSPSGTAHVFVWDAAADVGTAAVEGAKVRITPAGGVAQTSAPFTTGNDAPVVELAPIAAAQSGLVVVRGTISDSTADASDLLVEVAGVTPSATIAIGATSGLATAKAGEGGVPLSFAWNTIADLPNTNATVTLRVRARDAFDLGAAAEITFAVANNQAPVVVLGAVARQRGDIAIPLVLIDTAGDAVDLAISGSATRGATTLTLPAITLAAASEPLAGLGSSPQGSVHTIIWDSATDLAALSPATSVIAVRLDVTPLDAGGSGATQSVGPFIVGDEPPDLALDAIAGPQRGIVTLGFTLSDSTGDASDVALTFATPANPTPRPATLAVGSGASLAATPAGVRHTLGWNTIADLGPVITSVTITATPSDAATGAVVAGLARSITLQVAN